MNARALLEVEAGTVHAGPSLRCRGFFYGRGTRYHREGASARKVAGGRIPIVGDGQGHWRKTGRTHEAKENGDAA